MAQKKQDLKPDTVLKNYWRNNDRFADFFNAVLFEGKQVIRPEELEDEDTEESSVLEHRTDKLVIMTVAGATNSKIDYNAFEKGDGRMCTLFDEIARESETRGMEKGMEKGKAEGIIETGIDFGLSDKEILDRLQEKLNISMQTAQEYLLRFGRQSV